MNQKGFATIFGLCLILVIALMVKGIQESEMNHAYETTDFQIEMDLQNAADSGIYAAAEKVHQKITSNKNYLPLIEDDTRINHQVKVFSTTQKTSSGNISVEVWAERILIYPYRTNYNKYDFKKNRYIAELVDASKPKEQRKAYTLFSKAELTSKRIGGKLYRRSFAYVELKQKEIEDAEGNISEVEVSDKTIHFMDIAGNYTYKPESP